MANIIYDLIGLDLKLTMGWNLKRFTRFIGFYVRLLTNFHTILSWKDFDTFSQVSLKG